MPRNHIQLVDSNKLLHVKYRGEISHVYLTFVSYLSLLYIFLNTDQGRG